MPMFGLMTYNFQQLTQILFATQIELAVKSSTNLEYQNHGTKLFFNNLLHQVIHNIIVIHHVFIPVNRALISSIINGIVCSFNEISTIT